MLISFPTVHLCCMYACGHCWRVVSGWGWWPVIIGAICAIIPPALLLSVNTNPFILIIIRLIVAEERQGQGRVSNAHLAPLLLPYHNGIYNIYNAEYTVPRV